MLCAPIDLIAQSAAIEIQKNLADQIIKYEPENQAPAHKITLGSKYEEVQIYASANIHKYDKSARSESYKASVATGKPKVIAAANASLDKVNWEGVDRSLKVTPSTSATTNTKTMCASCNGSGKQPCTMCGGSGRLKCSCCNGTGIFTLYYSQTCNCCAGVGTTNCMGCYGMGRNNCSTCYGVGYVLSSSSTNYTSTTQQTAASSATIERVWADHNTFLNGMKGMSIHVKFSTNNMQHKQGNITAWIYYDNGNKLTLTSHNGAYTTPDKQVCAADYFTPGYVNAIYSDFVLFLPYNAIPNLGRGSHNLKFRVGIHHGNNLIATSEFQNFTISW